MTPSDKVPVLYRKAGESIPLLPVLGHASGQPQGSMRASRNFPSLFLGVRKIPLQGNHSNILAWRIPETEEPGGLQSTESLKSDLTEHAHGV